MRERIEGYVIVWQYDVRPAKRVEFEEAYAPDGVWASLFRASRDFLGTDLLRDTSLPDRYVTLDCWRTQDAFEAFLEQRRVEYEELDRLCEPLTVAEARLGAFWRGTGR